MMSADSKCKHCHGDGVVPVEREGKHPPAFKRCICVLHSDILANVERGLKGLSKVGRVKSSLLSNHLDSNVWFTADKDLFLRHLRHVAVRQPPTWFFRVCTDADLMAAWLATAALKGVEIFDSDVITTAMTHLTLMDLVLPPEVLVIRMGVKHARNVATPEVLLEAIRMRDHESKPTWIWDQPNERLAEGHIAWSPAVRGELDSFKHYSQKAATVAPTMGSTKTTGFSDMSLSGATGSKSRRKALPRGGDE